MSRWIGLAEIRATSSALLGEARGAYVAVVADAASKRDFARLIESDLSRWPAVLVRLEDVELLSERERSHALPGELRGALERISRENPVAYGTLHRYAD